jgi:peptidyl-prolyl cis-trans isomerase B (cyclophilin B)
MKFKMICLVVVMSFIAVGCKAKTNPADSPTPGANPAIDNPTPGANPAIDNPTPGANPAIDNPTPGANPATDNPTPGANPAIDNPSPKKEYKTSKPGIPVVEIETSLGLIVLELYPDKTPITVDNFLRYAEDKFFDGTIFHRVVPGFVIQGGGFVPDLSRRPTREPITNEAKNGIPNERGTICMARTPARESATSQFYINLKNNSMLNYRDESPRGWGYTAFGKVIEGMEVVDKIAAVETGPAGPFPKDVPKTPVLITAGRIAQ